ncbi:hypothetical protein LTR37_021251, partial [Vermiconidia calcicola]
PYKDLNEPYHDAHDIDVLQLIKSLQRPAGVAEMTNATGSEATDSSHRMSYYGFSLLLHYLGRLLGPQILEQYGGSLSPFEDVWLDFDHW